MNEEGVLVELEESMNEGAPQSTYSWQVYDLFLQVCLSSAIKASAIIQTDISIAIPMVLHLPLKESPTSVGHFCNDFSKK